MIRALIFDCFGVLYRDNSSRLYDTVPIELHQQMHDIMRACDYGLISRADYFVQLGELSGLGEAAIRDIDSKQHLRNEPLVAKLSDYRKEYKLGMLSNIGDETMGRLFPGDEIETLFDAHVLSSQVGMTKPSVAIFELAASRLGVLPEECIMIDDLPTNTDGASRAGMQTIVFANNQQFEIELKRLLAADA